MTVFEIILSNTLAAACLALVAFAASRLRGRPALVHALWILVLAKLLTLPLFRIPIGPLGLPTPEVAVAPRDDAARIAELEAMEPVEPSGESSVPLDSVDTRIESMLPPDPAPLAAAPAGASYDWRVVLICLSALGTAAILGVALLRGRRFAFLLRHAEQAPVALRDEADRLSRRLGMRRVPELYLVPGRLSPMLWGPLSGAKILFPVELLARLSESEVRSLLLHELAHVRRRDHWVRNLELAARAVYWWNPVVWWACRELHAAEEECCDAWVVWALRAEPRPYADALVKVLAFVSRSTALPAGATGIGPVENLNRRLIMIMNARTPRSLSPTARGLLLVLAAAVLPVVAALAQEEPKQAKLQKEVDRLIEQSEGDPHQLREILEMLEQKQAVLIEQRENEKAEEVARSAHRVGELLEKLARGEREEKKHRADDAGRGNLLDALKRAIRALEEQGDHGSAEQIGRLAEKIAKEANAAETDQRLNVDQKKRRAQLIDEVESGRARLKKEMDEARHAGDEDRITLLERDFDKLNKQAAVLKLDAIRASDSALDARFEADTGRSSLEHIVKMHEERFHDLAAKVERLTQIVDQLAGRLKEAEAPKRKQREDVR